MEFSLFFCKVLRRRCFQCLPNQPTRMFFEKALQDDENPITCEVFHTVQQKAKSVEHSSNIHVF